VKKKLIFFLFLKNKISASRQKIFSPETPPFFAREPTGFPARRRRR